MYAEAKMEKRIYQILAAGIGEKAWSALGGILPGEVCCLAAHTRTAEEARQALHQADVILAKGQGNYESLCNQGRHIFYSFLCKCDLFTERFRVPPPRRAQRRSWRQGMFGSYISVRLASV